MAIITGSSAADNLNGTPVADTISLFANSDRGDGGAGADTMSGGEGADTLIGGLGDDVIFGFGASDAQAGSGDITARLITNALTQPVFAASPPGDPGRLFVVEQHTGQIRILDTASGQIAATPFLDIPDAELSGGGEQGLLGLAFHPSYTTNGQFFVFLNSAARGGDIEVRRYQRSAADPDLANPASGDVILTIPHNIASNHNGGWMGFGPDGFLHIAVGDGGGGGDPFNNAQNKDSLLGKMLRIDVNGDSFAADPDRDYRIPANNPFVNQAGADEIWATGLRNPWRSSFDRQTGDLYIGDVGQGEREEVNYQRAGTPGGLNFGWKVKEGFLVYDDTVPGNPPATVPPLTDPLIDYGHVAAPDGGFAVTGGYVYRGTSAGMKGVYFYADFSTNQLWSFRVVNGVAVDFANRTAQLKTQGGTINSTSSFAEDGRGNLYIIGLDGELFRLDPQIGAGDGADTIDGGDGDDRVYGGAANDVLRGGAGNDRLDGGGGVNTMSGGIGDDSYYSSGAADIVSEALNQGNDILFATVNRTLAANVERLYVHGAATAGAGNALANLIYGNGSGNNLTLDGAGGDDAVYGSNQNDTLFGGTENDRLFGLNGLNQLRGGTGDDMYYSQAATDVIVEVVNQGLDTLFSTVNVTALANHVEQLIVYGAATSGAGNSLANRLYANSSALSVTLDGAGGGDVVIGSNQNDVLIGGDGNDVLNGLGGNDRFRFAAAGSGADNIVGFDANPMGGQDLIDVSGRGFTAASIGGAILIAPSGANTLITIGADTILLGGVGVANIGAGDFIF